jgi:hypothetical protein
MKSVFNEFICYDGFVSGRVVKSLGLYWTIADQIDKFKIYWILIVCVQFGPENSNWSKSSVGGEFPRTRNNVRVSSCGPGLFEWHFYKYVVCKMLYYERGGGGGMAGEIEI